MLKNIDIEFGDQFFLEECNRLVTVVDILDSGSMPIYVIQDEKGQKAQVSRTFLINGKSRYFGSPARLNNEI